MKNARIRGSVNEIARRPQGDWRLEHLFALKQALGAFHFVSTQLAECDREIEMRSSVALQPSASSIPDACNHLVVTIETLVS